MAAPTNRVPVRIARGLKATLDADIASIYEGEIVYATDEDSLYVKEGGVLVQAGSGGGGGGGSLESLTDTNLPTVVAPTVELNGYYNIQEPVWSNVNAAGEYGKYSSGGTLRVYMFNTDANTTDHTTAFGTYIGTNTGKTAVFASDAAFTQNVYTEDNFLVGSSSGRHYVQLTSDGFYQNFPSSGDMYFKFQTTKVEPEGALVWDSANDQWVSGGIDLNDLNDVDTRTSVPLTGELLRYDGTKFTPGSVSAQTVGGPWDQFNGAGNMGFFRPVTFYNKLPNGNKPTLAAAQNEWSIDIERQSSNVWIYCSIKGGNWDEISPGSGFNIGTPTAGSWYKPMLDAGLVDVNSFTEGDISVGVCLGSRCFHSCRVTAMEYFEDATNQYWGFRLFGFGQSPNEGLIDWLRAYSDTTAGSNAILDDVIPKNLTLYLPMPAPTFDSWDYDSLGQQWALTGASLRVQSFSTDGTPYWMPTGGDGFIKAINGRTNPEPPTYGNLRLGLYDVGLGQDYETTAGTNIIDAYWDIQLFGDTIANNAPAAQGEWRWLNDQNDDLEVLFFPTDMDGVDHSATFTNLAADESNMWVAYVYENVLYGPYKHTNSLTQVSGAWRFYFDKALANHMNVGRDSNNLPLQPDGDKHIRLIVGQGLEIALKTLTDGQPLVWNSKAQGFMSGPVAVPLADFKAQVALSTDFADFKSRVATNL